MFAAALIVFRETLEAALIVTIIMAATRGVPHRGKWISLGILGGLIGASTIAALTDAISTMFQGAGQEIVNASILFLAVVLIGWHIIWMNSHGRKLAEEMRAVGKSVSEGEKHLSILAIVVGLAVMREGSEIVLMLQGLWNTGDKLTMLGGGTLGLMAGVLTGALMYTGFLALSIARVFALTNGFLMLIAAGMAARGANFLNQADLVPSFGSRLWDTSAILPDQSAFGQLLGALVGYIARPSGIEVLFYAVTVFAILSLITMTRLRARRSLLAGAGIILACAAAMQAHPAFALDPKVYSPQVVKGEAELEYAGTHTFDSQSAKNNNQENQFSIGYAFTDFWKSELYFAEFERSADQPQSFSGNEFENIFQFWPVGKYWLDAGLLASYHFAAQKDTADSLELKLLLQKDIGRFTTLVNVGGEHDVGRYAASGTDLSSAINARYRWLPYLEPGLELQSDYGNSNTLSFSQQGHYLGPILYGQLISNLNYEVGYYRGVSAAASSSAMRLKLEYEFFF